MEDNHRKDGGGRIIINILKDSTGSLDTELVFTCPVCHRTFKHNDFQFPARWEDAIRKHLLKAHNGKRLGWDIIEIPDGEDPPHTVFPEGGTPHPPSHDEFGHSSVLEPAVHPTPVRTTSLEEKGRRHPSPSVLEEGVRD